MRRTPARGELAEYMEYAGRHPLLTAEEEADLAGRARAGDPDARDRLCRCNARLVVNIASRPRFRGRGLDLPDLVQWGSLGLVQAVDRFDPALGHRFSTYATPWIDHSIRRAIEDTARPIRLPVYLDRLSRRYCLTARAMEARDGRAPSVAAVADALGLGRLERAQLARAVEADGHKVRTGRAGHGDSPAGEMRGLVDDRPGPEATAATAEARARLRERVDALPPRLATVLRLRYGLDGSPPLTARDIAPVVGVVKQYVHILERQAIRRLRAELGAA
jgi:RNA polymerase primary sigma factor